MSRRRFLSEYEHYLPGIGGIFTLLALFLSGALLGNLLILALQSIDPGIAEHYGMVISYPVMFVPAMSYAAVRSRLNRSKTPAYPMDSPDFGGTPVAMMVLTVSIATLALAFLTDGISAMMPQMPENLRLALERLLDAPLWLTLLSVSVFAPFFEEWLCRGMIMRGLMAKAGPFAAITVSAAFFAVIHLNPWQAIPAFILGLLFGFVYYRTGSLKLTMLMHCVNNTMAAVFGRLEATKDAESFLDILNPVTYTGIALCCAAFITGAIMFLSSLRKGNS